MARNLSDDDLRNTVLAPHKRWVIRHKAAVVEALTRGIVTREEIQTVQGISEEELISWTRMVNQFGVDGLRVKRLQIYRAVEEGRRSIRTVNSVK